MSHPNAALANLLPEDRDCPYPLQGAVNVPMFTLDGQPAVDGSSGDGTLGIDDGREE